MSATQWPITSKRFEIRPYTYGDENVLASKFTELVGRISIDHSDAMVKARGILSRRLKEQGGMSSLFLGAFDLANKEFCADISFSCADRQAGEWAIGYYVMSRHRRTGVMSEVLSRVLPEVLARDNFNVVSASVDRGNLESASLLKKIGFHEYTADHLDRRMHFRIFSG